MSQGVQEVPSRFPAAMLSLVVCCLQKTFADLQVRCVLSVDGQVDAERMAKAVRLSLDAAPILGCRFVDHWRRPYWERRDDLDRVEVCRLVEITDLDKGLVHFMSAPIDPSTDPVVQVRILRSDTDTVCIKMEHMVADAYAIKEYAYLLASIYRTLAHNPRHVPTMSVCRSLRPITRGLSLLDMLRIIRRGCRDFKRRFFPPVFWCFPSTKGNLAHKTFAIRQFNPERFRALKAYGAQHQATLNDIMVSAFYRALFTFINPGTPVPLRVTNTVDLRRHMPSGKPETLCTLSNFSYLNIGPLLGSSFEETTLKVRNDTKALKGDYLGLGDLPLAALIFKTLPFSWARRLFNQQLKHMIKTGNAAPVFTNTGSINPEKLVLNEAPIKTAYILGATFLPPFFGMAVSTFRESITLSLSFFETAIERTTIERFLDQIDAELPV